MFGVANKSKSSGGLVVVLPGSTVSNEKDFLARCVLLFGVDPPPCWSTTDSMPTPAEMPKMQHILPISSEWQRHPHQHQQQCALENRFACCGTAITFFEQVVVVVLSPVVVLPEQYSGRCLLQVLVPLEVVSSTVIEVLKHDSN